MTGIRPRLINTLYRDPATCEALVQEPGAPANAAAVPRVSAAIVESVAGASARLAAFWSRQPFVCPVADAPSLAVAGVSAGLFPVAQLAFAAVADISGPPSDSRCWAGPDVPLAEGPWGGLSVAASAIRYGARHRHEFLACK